MQGERVPVIHTVGFFAEEQQGGPGERFLRQLSALTGGTFQVRPLSYYPALLSAALPYHAQPCPAFPCPALVSLVLPCPALSSLCITMLCPSVLLCCAGLGYARLQVPQHAVPVSHNASPPLACHLPAMSTTPFHHICLTYSSWLPVMMMLFLLSCAAWWHPCRMLVYLCLQEYRPEVWRVWSGGEWLEYDLARETAAVKAERLWCEAALQAQRRNNARCISSQAMRCIATCDCFFSMPSLSVTHLLLGS